MTADGRSQTVATSLKQTLERPVSGKADIQPGRPKSVRTSRSTTIRVEGACSPESLANQDRTEIVDIGSRRACYHQVIKGGEKSVRIIIRLHGGRIRC